MQSSKPIPKEQIEDFISNTTQAYVDGKIVQTITDGDTTHSPSGNVVFDSLATKLTTSLGTNGLPESGGNLYFTTARVLATLLTGISFATGGAIVSTNSVLQAFGKIQKQINDLSSIFVPLTRTLTINGTTQDLTTNRTFTIASGGEKAIYSSYPTLGLTSLNTWRTWGRSSSMVGVDSNQLIGTGPTPTITGTTAYGDTNYFLVKDCSSLSKMTLTVRENMSPNVTVEFFVKSFDLVSGVGRGSETNGQLLIQEVVNLGGLGSNFIKDDFVISSHALNSNTALYFFYRITSATGVNIQGVHLKLNFN